jgi:hypothetical protein
MYVYHVCRISTLWEEATVWGDRISKHGQLGTSIGGILWNFWKVRRQMSNSLTVSSGSRWRHPNFNVRMAEPTRAGPWNRDGNASFLGNNDAL